MQQGFQRVFICVCEQSERESKGDSGFIVPVGLNQVI